MPFLSSLVSPDLEVPSTKGKGASPSGAIVLMALVGIGALLFTAVAGYSVYSQTQGLVAAKDWVQHTQEVLTTVQSASQLTDRIELSSRLYQAAQDDYRLNDARRSAANLEATAAHLHELVAEDPKAGVSARQVAISAATLADSVRTASNLSQVPVDALLRCREALSLMAEQEHSLLSQRAKASQQTSEQSLRTQMAFISFSLVTLIVLFGVLLRDAYLRRRGAQQSAIANANLEAGVRALEERISESRLLTACRDELQLCVNLQQIYRAAADCICRLLTGTTGSIAIINNSRQQLEVVSSWGTGSEGTRVAATFASDACCGLRLGQLRWREPGVSEIDCTHFHAIAPRQYLCVPMSAQGDTIGVISLECETEAATNTVRQRMDGLRQLVQLTSMAVASLNLRTRLENQSIRDALTGLFNRHFMQIVLGRELSSAQRQGSSVAVFMVDVDHFKAFNDTHGHGAGDAMLQSIAEAFTSSVRTEDTVCRYGGEEFAIILPGMTQAAALERAERIRRAVHRLHVEIEGGAYAETSVSIGVALYPADAVAPEQLLRKADQALYRAKHNGRNQVVMAESLTLPLFPNSSQQTVPIRENLGPQLAQI